MLAPKVVIGAGFGSATGVLESAPTDKVGAFYVFDISGNKFRLIAAVHFNVQKLYVRHVFTHKEYNKWKP